MTAGHEGTDGAARDGMDALMAAITGEPLPEDARRDPAVLAEHRAAEADLAVLRGRLTWLAEALTGETQAPASGEEPAPAQDPARAAERAAPPPAAARPPGDRPRSRTRPTGRSRPPRPGRPSGPRRAWRIALGSLAGAAAFSLALGLGWLVANSPGGLTADGGADEKTARSAADATAEAAGRDGRPADPARELACSRLVVEGTVTGVGREPSGGSRVTLTVIRSYRPAHGPAEVSFRLDGGAEPAPRAGQHVLVRVGKGRQHAGLWAVGDARVADARAWITEALPESRHLACPSGGTP
ncbi:hypothetical protein GCM10010503_11540 [Streptomyces lucensis JCM 4490]|uniref:Uncharacterized protein n=1 Tax=Streptomyces lucensis JCM 4490 TaxID=1306176 RepID=A0A918IXT8_9ACTN|nr:hypothetical protein [Streptomyces lucensis]GGW37275.1 hypothetical protein GCM10010503_11540 [Streptomyces lucensis JCM 4490]